MKQRNNYTVDIQGRDKGAIERFYASWKWRQCKNGYMKSVGGLCERCSKRGLIEPADEVHHKIRLNAKNINKPEIALNWANLEALCEDCHKEEHRKQRRWTVDENGTVSAKDPP